MNSTEVSKPYRNSKRKSDYYNFTGLYEPKRSASVTYVSRNRIQNWGTTGSKICQRY